MVLVQQFIRSESYRLTDEIILQYESRYIKRGPLTIWEKGSLGWWAVGVFWFLLGSRYRRRPNPTPDSTPNPDPKPQPKRVKTRHKRGCAAFASNQEISQLRTTIPKCRPRYAFFKSKTSLKISSPRLLNLLGRYCF